MFCAVSFSSSDDRSRYRPTASASGVVICMLPPGRDPRLIPQQPGIRSSRAEIRNSLTAAHPVRSPRRQSAADLRQGSRHAPARARVRAHCPARNAPAAAPALPRSGSWPDSPAPSLRRKCSVRASRSVTCARQRGSMDHKDGQAVVEVGPKDLLRRPAGPAAGASPPRFSRPPEPVRSRRLSAVLPFRGIAAASPAAPAASRRFHPGRGSRRARPQSARCVPAPLP